MIITDEIKKQYYSIGEVSASTGREESTIRYWDEVFEINAHRRSGGNLGYRKFTEEQKQKLEEIAMLTSTGFYTVKGIKAIIEEVDHRKNKVYQQWQEFHKVLASTKLENGKESAN